ncbi:MAG: M67 family metallopeptidase [Rhodospirillaceae bacterium]|nr:M67 family metallopeptidase [Rhodospirillaceae bacterium]MBT3491650.1 M67 family metallopeptidase [Rhodospirillaceae bacterium]MBT3783294.1 M67 family metallopeptidase [Rhodospirillaceae bacterium]MBT3978290.1 M67 family metallopeptidase [Rhodospirillaceae bacterium]MBT4563676.1 M67 family metallopeptidase [Rhodospirillaceae bacterium]
MIVLPKAPRAAIATHAAADYPNEACGLLLGRRDGEDMIVSQAVASANVADEPSHRFAIDPGLRLRLQKAARTGTEQILGHYHSHPDGAAKPSKTDQAGIYEADLVWLIASVRGGQAGGIAAFMPWADCGGFDEIELRDD